MPLEPRTILLVDVGNTRVKWAMLAQGQLSVQSAVAHRGREPASVIREFLDGCDVPARVLVSNVAGAVFGEQLATAVAQKWGLTASFVTASPAAGGIRNAYAEPEKLGVDRWLAMIGARTLTRELLCVASVGTALTVDALDTQGTHLGGLIVPGPDLMVASLLQQTSEIAPRALSGEEQQTFFATNTRAAIEAGSAHACAALIERAIAQVQQLRGEVPQLFVTGGATARVLPRLRCSHREVPDLVLRGLAVVALE